MEPDNDALDLLIIGGGPAGMAAALVAGRARLRTLVVNGESPRNAVTHASHGFLTRDGAHPMELLAIAKAQLEKYPSVAYQADQVSDVAPSESGYVVTTAAGAVHATQRVVIATGYRDDLSRLNLPGAEAVYGKSLFPCPFCDGFEHADQAIAVFVSAMADHYVPLMQMWSDDLVVFTNGAALGPDFAHVLQVKGIAHESVPVAALESADGRLTGVRLADGRVIPRSVGFVAEDYSVPATDFAERLGVPHVANWFGAIGPEADEWGATAVEGVYVVGDAKTAFGSLQAAAQAGAACAQRIVFSISTARWARPTGEWNASVAEWYAANYGEYATNRLGVEAIDLPADAAVIDIGCGTGSALRHASARVTAGRLIGIDPVPRMLELAGEACTEYPQIELHLGSAEAIPVDDAVADVVLAFDSFDHWRNKAAGLAELRRVLKPGGRLVVLKDAGAPDAAKGMSGCRGHLEQAGFIVSADQEIARDGVAFSLLDCHVAGDV